MYICEHFKLHELVDRTTLSRFGIQAWQFFNPAALAALDGVRNHFGRPVTVNNWMEGGQFSWRGLRLGSGYDTELTHRSIGARWSQHRLGNAFDCDVQGLSPDEARQEILAKPDKFPLITCIELDVNWLHFDCRNIPDRIRTVRP